MLKDLLLKRHTLIFGLLSVWKTGLLVRSSLDKVCLSVYRFVGTCFDEYLRKYNHFFTFVDFPGSYTLTNSFNTI